MEEQLAKLKDAKDDDDDFDDVSSECSAPTTKPALLGVVEDLKAEVKEEPDDSVRENNAPTIKPALEGGADDVKAEVKEEPGDVKVDALKPSASDASDVSGNKVETSDETAKSDNKTLFEKLATGNFFDERKILNSDVIDLDADVDIKMEESDASQASRSQTPTPKPEVDASDDVDSATIERMLAKQERFDFVVNITDALASRTHYPRMTKPPSKLDSLLERRQRHQAKEEHLRQVLDSVLLRCRVQAIQKRRYEKELEEKKRIKSGQQQASATKTRDDATGSETDSDVELSTTESRAADVTQVSNPD